MCCGMNFFVFILFGFHSSSWLCVRQLLSRVQLFAVLWTVACQAPLSMKFSRQEYWSGLSFPSPEDLPDQGSNLGLQHCKQMLYCLSYQRSPSWLFLLPNFLSFQPMLFQMFFPPFSVSLLSLFLGFSYEILDLCYYPKGP